MAVICLPVASFAGPVVLADFAANADGVLVTSVAPGSFFDTTTGLGTFLLRFSGAGTHSGFLFVDHELSENFNGFENELGSTSGSPVAGQTWEIDEPGFSASPGDIYDNFTFGQLDNSIGKSAPDDVSMSLGWNFDLKSGESAWLTFVLGAQAPTSPFYLLHSDPDSGETVYFSSSFRVSSVPDADNGVPMLGLAAVLLAARWRRFSTPRRPDCR